MSCVITSFNVVKLKGLVMKKFAPAAMAASACCASGMDEPEDVIENLRVVRILLKTHELDVDHVETLVRLGDKFPQQVAHKKCRFPSEARPVCR